jgi:chromosomal replication initiation ATPase DnaA
MKPRNTVARVLEIIEEEAANARILPAQILSDMRHSRYRVPRWRAMWRARKETDFSNRRLAAIFCHDHTSLKHAVVTVDKLLARQREADSVRLRTAADLN